MAKVKMSVRFLETITSALYDEPLILFREYIQNSIDAYNAEIMSDSNKTIKNLCQ